MMNAIVDAALAYARTILSALLLLILAGWGAYVSIPKESDPDINIPIIYVSMSLEGISPGDAERLLLRPMEQELRTIEGVKEMRATAYQGGGNVVLEFDAGFDADQALTDVREKVDLVRPDLPDGVDEPTVNEVNFSLFPVLVVSLSGEVPERTLLRLARDLKDGIQGLTAVLEATIAGDREELVEIIVDPVLLDSYGIRFDEVLNIFQRSNRLVAAGNLDTGAGRFAIKVPGLFESVEDVWDMPIKVSGDAVVRARDVATIRRSFKDPESFARVGGQSTVALEVKKRAGENIIETIEAVKAVVTAEQATWPAGVTVTYSQDRSTDIRNMLTDLQNNLISAVLLVLIVCIAALGLRSALLVGVAIPGAFLTGILVLSVMGLTVNVVVLFALILAVGMLVDGAIVVTEYADRRMLEGAPRWRAYAEAGKVMAWPILSSGATTIMAFLPLMFWPGVVGEFMKYLPITLIAVLAASLAMAIIFVPVLGAQIGRPGEGGAAMLAMLEASERGDVTRIGGAIGAYLRVLSGCLRRPVLVLLGAFGMLIGVQFAYANYGRGVEFFPEVEPQIASVLVHARGNLSIWEQDALVREVEARVLESEGVKFVYTRTGSAGGGGAGGGGGGGGQDMPEDVIGTILLEFEDWDARPNSNTILADIRARTRDIAGIRVTTRKEEGGPPTGKDVQVELTSRVPELLPQAVATVRRGFEEVGGLVDIEDSRPLPGIEWRITVDRAQAYKFGVDLSAVGEAVKLITNGILVGTYRPDDSDDEIDIVLRYPEDLRTVDELDRIRIETDAGAVPIGNFVNRQPQPRVGTLNREEGQRIMSVKADVPPGTLVDDKVQEVRRWLEAHPLDPRISVNFAGADEEQAESEAFLGNAFGVALFLMAVILVTQFNSFFSALLILSAVILSTIGVFLGLLITGQPFGVVMSGIGVIALAGIVVNNNIILIDTYDRVASGTADAREAVLRTCAQRVRPVMLTTVTTILGLMPMVLSMNIDFATREVSFGAPSTQWWVQLATAIAFGLSFATVLTLLVTPSALMARANLKAWWARRRGRGAPIVEEPAAPTLLPVPAE